MKTESEAWLDLGYSHRTKERLVELDGKIHRLPAEFPIVMSMTRGYYLCESCDHVQTMTGICKACWKQTTTFIPPVL